MTLRDPSKTKDPNSSPAVLNAGDQDDPAPTNQGHPMPSKEAGSGSLPIAKIGFTRSSAEGFFDRLKHAGAKRVIDVRLNNTSQLSGFAKAGDLAFFLDRIAGIDYLHRTELAPTDVILKDLQKKRIDWPAYEERFLDLLADRKIETILDPELLEEACLLCSEHVPHHCHRRLVCEYLNEHWGGRLSVTHL